MRTIQTLALLVSAAILSWGDSLTAQEKLGPSYYPLDDGNRWTYRMTIDDREIDKIVTEIEEVHSNDGKTTAKLATTLMSTGESNVEVLVQTDSGLERHKVGNLKVHPPVGVLKFPIKFGDRWEIDSQIGPNEISGHFEIGKKIELVEVPAGEFRGIVASSEFTMGELTISAKIWYAEGVGPVKTLLIRDDIPRMLELEKFEKRNVKRPVNSQPTPSD